MRARNQIPGQMTIDDFLKAIPVDIKGICDDAYCPECNCCLDEYKYLDQDCPYCHTRLDWAPWHRKNDDWWLNRKSKEVE